MTVNPLLTTDEIHKLVASLATSYGKRWNDNISRHLFDYIASLVNKSELTGPELADSIREYVWHNFSGGGTSAQATRNAFRLIGKFEWCDPRWV